MRLLDDSDHRLLIVALYPWRVQDYPGFTGDSLVLALIFGVGLFAGLEFAGNSTSNTATTTTRVVTASTTSSNGTTIATQQEAAIAKVEPAVVELEVTTAQGQQIGSGVIIDTKGDIVTNYHIVKFFSYFSNRKPIKLLYALPRI